MEFTAKIRNDAVCAPREGESPDDYLNRHGITHFTFEETLRLRRAGLIAPMPPRHWLPRIIPALWFAEALREALGGLPVSVGNGFRPSPRHPELRDYPDLNGRVGGARRSKHIGYRALDLDPHRSLTVHDVRDAAARLYYEIYRDVVVGLGFYSWSRRVHIDIGPNDPVSWGDRVRDAVWGPTSKGVYGKTPR